MSKETWFRYYEARLAEGFSDEEACEMALNDTREHFADLIDAAKDRAKAEGNWPPRKPK
jgi:hypothetical protein